MDVVVCIKAVLDPDLPPAKFKVDEKKNTAVQPEGMPLVMNPYDALAIEAALRIKENKEGKVFVLTVGDKSGYGAIKKALAMGADEAICLSDPTFEESDSFGTAYILFQAIKKIGKIDLVLCGRQAADWDFGVVGSALAERLGVPAIARAKTIELLENGIKIERATMKGLEVFESPLPAVVTLSSEFGQARIPTGRGIIFAARKNIPVWNAQDLGTDTSYVGRNAQRNSILKLYIPSYVRACKMFDGGDKAAAASTLADTIISLRKI